ncbi:fungal-specific transcription factor, partial [Ramicandelaber brevisporus]
MILDRHYSSTSVSTVQALTILAFARDTIGTTEGWIHSGLALRMGFDLGLHRDCDAWDWMTAAMSGSDKESRKRAWWGSYIMDRLFSVCLGRPLSIDDRDYDTGFP